MTSHARDEMAEANASAEDVRRAILSATKVIAQPNGVFRMEGGCDSDGESLVVVVTFYPGGLKIITVFG